MKKILKWALVPAVGSAALAVPIAYGIWLLDGNSSNGVVEVIVGSATLMFGVGAVLGLIARFVEWAD